MNWTSVQTTCDCPDKLEVWECTLSERDVDCSVDKAVTICKDERDSHINSSEYCSEETCETEVYYKESV